MRIWVERNVMNIQVSLQPDGPDEEKALDRLLEFPAKRGRIPAEPGGEPNHGFAQLGGHESLRYILIPV